MFKENPSAQLFPRTLPGFLISRYGNDSRYIVKDVSLTHYILTNAVGVRVLELSNGERTIDEIIKLLTDGRNVHLQPQRLTQFLDEGTRVGLIDPASWPISAISTTKRKPVTFVQIDTILAWLDNYRSWWLNPITKLAAWILTAVGLVQLFYFPRDTGLFAAIQMSTFTLKDAIFLALPLIFIIEIALHELAHALACHTYGARTRGISFKLMWGIVPAIVTDTHDAYSITNKFHRMFVSFAGPMVNIVSFGIVMTLYHAFDPTSVSARILLAYSMLSLVTIVVTLNPFLLSMDGYWIAADYLENPNLRKVAMGHLRDSFSRFPSLGRSHKPAMSKHSSRAAIGYTLYATVSLCWTGLVVARFGYELFLMWDFFYHMYWET